MTTPSARIFDHLPDHLTVPDAAPTATGWRHPRRTNVTCNRRNSNRDRGRGRARAFVRRSGAVAALGALIVGVGSVAPAAGAGAETAPESCASILSPSYTYDAAAFGGGGIPFVMDAGTDVQFPDQDQDPASSRPVEVIATAPGGHERRFPIRPGHNDLRVDAGVTAFTHVEWNIPMTDGSECHGYRDVVAVLSQDRPHVTFTVPRWGQTFDQGEKVWPQFNCDDNGYHVSYCVVQGLGRWNDKPYESDDSGSDHSIPTGSPGTQWLDGWAQDRPNIYDTPARCGNTWTMYFVRGNPDDPAKRPLQTSLDLYQRSYPSGQWQALRSGDTVVAGNTVKAVVTVRNVSTVRRQVEASVRADLPIDDAFITGQYLGPGEQVSKTAYLDTTDAAWNAYDASPRSDPLKVMFGASGGDQLREVSIRIKTRPLILVHGWKTNAASSWGTYQQIIDADPYAGGYLDTYAVGDGKVPGTMNTNGGGDGDAGARTNTLAENAEQEALYIEGVRKATNAWHVDVLAHSMGGLISRKYVQDLMPADQDGHPVVHRLLQMGTPNRGSPLADLIMAFGAGGSSTTIPFYPASLQLTTSYVDQIFNQLVTNNRGVAISNMVGTNIPLVGMPTIPRLFGDGIVPAYSARWNLTTTQDSAYDFHTAMTESAKDFANYVKPLLATPVQSGAAARSSAAPAPATASPTASPAAAAAATDTGVQTSSVSSVHVKSGQTVDVALPAEATGTIGALTVDPGVELQIRSTAGKLLASSANGDAAEANGVPQVQVPRPAGGAARLRIVDHSNHDRDVAVLRYTSGSTLGLTAAAEPVGAQARVTATLVNKGAPVTAAQLYATPANDPNAGQTPMRDDGTLGDVTAGDGTFTALLDAVTTGGPVAVRASSAVGNRITTVLTGTAAPGAGTGGTTNTAPRLDACDLTGGVTVNEGDTLDRTVSIVDPDAGDSWTASVGYGDGTATTPAQVANGKVVLRHRYRQDGNRTVQIKISDAQGATGSMTVKVRVRNVAPTAQLDPLAQPRVTDGDTVTLTGRVADRGLDDTLTASFGLTRAGKTTVVSAQVGPDGTVRATVAAAAGVYTISLRVTDDARATNNAALDTTGAAVVLTVAPTADTAHGVLASFDAMAAAAGLPAVATDRLRPVLTQAVDLAVDGRRTETQAKLAAFTSAATRLGDEKKLSTQQLATVRSWLTTAKPTLMP